MSTPPGIHTPSDPPAPEMSTGSGDAGKVGMKRPREEEEEEDGEGEEGSDAEWPSGSEDNAPFDYAAQAEAEDQQAKKRAKLDTHPASEFLRQIREEEELVRVWEEVGGDFAAMGYPLGGYKEDEDVSFALPGEWEYTLSKIQNADLTILTPSLQLDALFTRYSPCIHIYLLSIGLLRPDTPASAFTPTQEDYTNHGLYFRIPDPTITQSQPLPEKFATLAGVTELMTKIDNLLLTQPPSYKILRETGLKAGDLEWLIGKYRAGAREIASQAGRWGGEEGGMEKREWESVKQVLEGRKAVKYYRDTVADEEKVKEGEERVRERLKAMADGMEEEEEKGKGKGKEKAL